MTGQEFEASVKAAGYTQIAFAQEMGVYRTTVAKQFKAKSVDPLWVYALIGLIAEKNVREINTIISSKR